MFFSLFRNSKIILIKLTGKALLSIIICPPILAGLPTFCPKYSTWILLAIYRAVRKSNCKENIYLFKASWKKSNKIKELLNVSGCSQDLFTLCYAECKLHWFLPSLGFRLIHQEYICYWFRLCLVWMNPYLQAENRCQPEPNYACPCSVRKWRCFLPHHQCWEENLLYLHKCFSLLPMWPWC